MRGQRRKRVEDETRTRDQGRDEGHRRERQGPDDEVSKTTRATGERGARGRGIIIKARRQGEDGWKVNGFNSNVRVYRGLMNEGRVVKIEGVGGDGRGGMGGRGRREEGSITCWVA